MPYTLTDPVGALDIARRLGVKPNVVANWRVRHIGFPAPIFTVSAGRIAVWEWLDVAVWQASRTASK
jgi:hypothetical protein